jgi:hypothetical protein
MRLSGRSRRRPRLSTTPPRQEGLLQELLEGEGDQSADSPSTTGYFTFRPHRP